MYRYHTYVQKRERFTTLPPIPKRIVQTYHTLSRIPREVYENISQFAPGYEHRILDDEGCIAFLQSDMPHLVSTFVSLTNGAHKADLFRYAWLYVHGGVYLDIKTELLVSMDELLSHPVLYTVLATTHDHIYQGILAAPPRLPIFAELISFIVQTGNPVDYHAFCKDLYQRLMRIDTPTPGYHSQFYLWEERCSHDSSQCYDGLDRWGLCCYVWNGDQRIIKTRRSSYPW